MNMLPLKRYHLRPLQPPEELDYSNYCLSFDGTQWVQIPDSPSLAFSGVMPIYIKAWVYPPTSVGSRRILAQADEIVLRVNPPNNVEFILNSFALPDRIQGPTVLPLNRWSMVEGFFDGTNMVVAINAVNDNSVVFGGGLYVDTGFSWGISTLGLGFEKFVGRIDEVEIRDTIPTPQERRKIFWRGYARRETSSRLVTRMEEGLGPTAFDSSGNGNNGTLMPVLTPPAWTRVSQYELPAGVRP